MAEQVPIENVAYALLIPIRTRYAPTMELLRKRMILIAFNEENPTNVEKAELSLAVLRILDLINKSELKSLFLNRLEWFSDFNLPSARSISFMANALLPIREKVLSRSIKEMTALGVPEPTARAIRNYLSSDNVVDQLSAFSAITLISCLASQGNRQLIWRKD